MYNGIVIIPFIICIYWARRSEKKEWNKGVCPICGNKWKCFAMDSQGGRMYRCSNWHFCDISYDVDK